MSPQTLGQSDTTISGRSKAPLDVRIVAYLMYLQGFIGLMASFLAFTASSELPPRRVLFGSVIITSNLVYSVYGLALSVSALFFGYGLMRGIRFGWWLSLGFCVYGLTDTVLVFRLFREHPIAVPIIVVLDTLEIVWLLFRRKFYGIYRHEAT